jgi:uncharacterized protein (DUF1330 family)
MTEHVTPDLDQIVARFAAAGDTPVVMLNLNRYREVAQYPPDHAHASLGLDGRSAYLHYGVVAQSAIHHVGGHILWAADVGEVVIGCDHDAYDEVLAVWYPSRNAFLRLGEYPGYMDAHVHRDAALEQSTLLAVAGNTEPVLRNPFPDLRGPLANSGDAS